MLRTDALVEVDECVEVMEGEGVGAVDQGVSFLIDRPASSQDLQVQAVGVDAAGVRCDLLNRAPHMLVGGPAGGIEALCVREPLRPCGYVKNISVDEEVGVYLAADGVWQSEQWRGREILGGEGVSGWVKAARIW